MRARRLFGWLERGLRTQPGAGWGAGQHSAGKESCCPPWGAQAGELAAWQAATGAAPAAFSRLASAEEVAPLVGLAQELLAPKKDDDEGAPALRFLCLGVLGWRQMQRGCFGLAPDVWCT